VRELCNAEIIARSCKKILRYELQQTVLQFSSSSSSLWQSLEVQQQQQQFAGADRHRRAFTIQLNTLLAGFLNLVLGRKNAQSVSFWTNVLSPQIKHDFEFDIEVQSVRPGYLLHALAQHLNIDWEFDISTQEVYGGEVRQENLLSRPVRESHLKQLLANAKSYKIVALPYHAQGLLHEHLRAEERFEEALASILARLDYATWLCRDFEDRQYERSLVLCEYAELLLLGNNYTACEEACALAAKLCHALHVHNAHVLIVALKSFLQREMISEALACFSKVLTTLTFSLG
jgi:hypothetical protein